LRTPQPKMVAICGRLVNKDLCKTLNFCMVLNRSSRFWMECLFCSRLAGGQGNRIWDLT
jgi:hypothetical protein